MNQMLIPLFSLSLSGSFLIVALLVSSCFLKRKTSRQWQYYIWMVVVIRLLVPFAPETNLMKTVFQKWEQTVLPGASINLDQEGVEDGIQNGEAEGSYNMETKPEETAPSGRKRVWEEAVLLKDYVWLLWLFMASMLFIRKLTIYQNFVQYVRAGQAPAADIRLLDKLAVISKEAGIKRAIELCVNPLISSPLLIGFFRPVIVLPDLNLTETEFQYTIRHELVHYKRRDMFYKWAVQAAICIHWFNPLVYWMGNYINRLCELSCDEAIVSKLDFTAAQDYGKTLLHAMNGLGKYKEALASITLSENKKLLRERLEAIMEYKKKSKYMVFITFIMTVIFMAGATALGVYAKPTAAGSNVSREDATDISKLSRRQKSLMDDFEPYRAYGITYDPFLDTAYYKGKPVKAFADFQNEPSFYVFQLGYFDDKPEEDGLYLMTTHDSRWNITGIIEMPEGLKRELYGDLEKEEGENKKNLKNSDITYVTFQGTTKIGKEITATDNFDSNPIPKEVKEWMAGCKAADVVYVKKTVKNNRIDAWLCCNSSKKYGWKMDTEGDEVQFTFQDYSSDQIEGPTVIHYEAPASKNKLKVFLGSKELTVKKG